MHDDIDPGPAGRSHHRDSHETRAKAPPYRAGSIECEPPRVRLDWKQRQRWQDAAAEAGRLGRITGAGLKVALAFLRFLIEGDGRVFPSLAMIGAAAGCSENTVLAAIDDLEGCGLLERIRRKVRVPGIGHRQGSNAYRLILPAAPAQDRAAEASPQAPRQQRLSVLRARLRAAAREFESLLTNCSSPDFAVWPRPRPARLCPQPPIRTVQEQLALLLGAPGTG